MREAHIQCLARRHMISDLGFRMVEGQVEVVTEAEAKASADLKHAQKVGAVAVAFVQRAKTTKFERTRRKKPLQKWDGTRPEKSNLPRPSEDVFNGALSAFDNPKNTTGRRKPTSRPKASSRRNSAPKKAPETTPEVAEESQDA